MNDITRIDVGKTGDVVKKIKAADEELGAALADVVRTYRQHYGCWGADPTGKQFEKQFVGPANDFLLQSQDLKGELVDSGESLAEVPALFDETDQSNNI